MQFVRDLVFLVQLGRLFSLLIVVQHHLSVVVLPHYFLLSQMGLALPPKAVRPVCLFASPRFAVDLERMLLRVIQIIPSEIDII